MKSKSKIIISGLIILLFMSGSYLVLQGQSKNVVGKKLRKIVIDAGHGGRDPGCHGQYSYEKDIALDVSKKLGELVRQNLKGIRVLQTRDYDWYPALKERHKIANDAKADLFISVHVNSSPKRVTTANGTETYVLGLHRNDQKEGAIGEYASNFSQEGGLLNPQDPMTQILIAQYSQTFLASSILLGTFVEDEFSKQGRKSMGVKQKGLEVLAGSAMPAVLVELGFLNNPGEEAMLNSQQGKLNCANAIYKAIVRYKKEVEKGTAIQSAN